MRITREELSIKVVVRRLRTGSAPFIWEITRDHAAEPLCASADGFRSMEEAYRAGRARLREFVPPRRPAREMTEGSNG
jgi:hypothetical protein